jgi:hypothetical protein
MKRHNRQENRYEIKLYDNRVHRLYQGKNVQQAWQYIHKVQQQGNHCEITAKEASTDQHCCGKHAMIIKHEAEEDSYFML